MSNAIERAQQREIVVPQPSAISQSTAVEQARAVAEVQAAVLVAQQVPRDVDRALAEMRVSCSRLGLANRAFYSVPNRGTGPSVHLARELARIWGNLDYGVHELRQDLAAGMSEVRAFAWDQQANVRSTRTFQVPHARMKKVGGKPVREPLVDLTDVYLSNQNLGARAVRECVFTVVPTWFTDEAVELCRRTLETGEVDPNGQATRTLDERISDCVASFSKLAVTVDQLERHVDRKRAKWTPEDLAQLAITYSSIKNDGVRVADAFPDKVVTTKDIRGEGNEGEGYDPTADDANPWKEGESK
ncbi:hypothetical protein [Tenggerimyces flavus]|uniref:Uncharacterized protein n=1 Tax=Tenggerimyces flavus TaxID=1708749 RepID=A0ABV7Y9N0_9ACTN|nr:hypothetical protein [Tenggerimyces flavus]MBM7788881.1 hypothetical protein [Tenggerimyces flavus]